MLIYVDLNYNTDRCFFGNVKHEKNKKYYYTFPPFHVFQILKAMGLAKTASAALNLLIDIGYFPAHVNLDLLKYNIRTDFSADLSSAAENLLAEPSDQDEVHFLCYVYRIVYISVVLFRMGYLNKGDDDLFPWSLL